MPLKEEMPDPIQQDSVLPSTSEEEKVGGIGRGAHFGLMILLSIITLMLSAFDAGLGIFGSFILMIPSLIIGARR